MNLKDYQNDAINELRRKAQKLLGLHGTKRMVFMSPTGSGKTVMLAEFLKQLAEDSQVHPFACIWTAPRALHLQSKKKLDRYYADTRILDCAEFNELNNREIGERQILFFNWESVRQETNVFIRENEQDNYLHKVVENTRDAQRNIILIVDESHYHLSPKAIKLIDEIAPKLIVYASATPGKHAHEELVTVYPESVKDEGMIKKSVVINEGFGDAFAESLGHAQNDDSFGEIVLGKALDKRRQLAEAFQANNIDVNPLLCVQLPDNRTEQDQNIHHMVEEVLEQHGITVKNGKFSVNLSEDKKNLERIEKNNNEVEVMLFKQTIALGWDCPRAHILVLFRHWSSSTFSVQTLGRIMRMPEPENGRYYPNELLNSAYVYSDLPVINIGNDVPSDYAHIYNSKRADNYSPLQLPSVHRLRQREKTRIAYRQFSEAFLQAAEEMELKNRINTNGVGASISFIREYEAQDVDQTIGESVGEVGHVDATNELDLQKLLDYFLRENSAPYYPGDDSMGSVRNAIYDFFSKAMSPSIHCENNFALIVNIVLSDGNRELFASALDDAKEKYRKKTEERKEPLQVTKCWEVAQTLTFGENYCQYDASSAKSIMQPFYVAKNQSDQEKNFIEFLEQDKNVLWWYKNGEQVAMHFAVPYTAYDDEKPFYVDFIVRLTDGRIGLFDTKSGMTIDAAHEKSDGLLAYIKRENKTRTVENGKLIGGIVTKHDHRPWKIYRGKGADLTSNDLSNWDWLDLTPPQ